MKIDIKKFFETTTYTGVEDLATVYERIQESINFNKAQSYFGIPSQRGANPSLDYFNILMSKKISTQDRVLSKQQKLEDDIKQATQGMINDDLSEEANEIFKQINNEAKIKFLQLYFDAYMAPKLSDNQWRLGTVTGSVLETDFSDENNLQSVIQNGRMYTRSQFTIPYFRRYCDNGKIEEKLEYFSSTNFPPYKVGASTPIDKKTNFMRKILRVNPNATFDQDNFFIRKEGYTYREAGFKSINDYISFLQWITEGITGIVSTYMTEWDLSVYMQEHLMVAVENGGPMKLYLNYRVRDDNPLADSKGNYTDDRALVFNVAGSAVSKIDFDCTKYWRPSDYPLSQWWTPYLINKHIFLKPFFDEDYYEVARLTGEKYPLPIWYMDIYDKKYAGVNYENMSLSNIMKRQDYFGMCLGVQADELSRYYQTFYTTDMDTLTDFDVKCQGWVKKVAGCNPGGAQGKQVDDFITLAKEEMLLNGGYWGAPTPAGMGQGGIAGKKAMSSQVASQMSKKGTMPKQSTGSKMFSDAGKEASNASASGSSKALNQDDGGADLNQLDTSESQAQELLDSGLNNKANAAIMAKYTGINRFAPAIFGGPHGADYSPNTIQGYFDEDNIFFRNIPRISVNTSKTFTSVVDKDYFTDNNKFYKDEDGNGISPNKALSFLSKGTGNYYIDYGTKKEIRTAYITGTIKYNYRSYGWFWGAYNSSYWTEYDMPTKSPQGETYYYSGNYIFDEYTESYKSNPWTQNNWWYNYNAYYHSFNTYYYKYFGWGYSYYVKSYKVRRLASYYYISIVPFKRYDMDGMADTNWEIIEHNNITTYESNPVTYTATTGWWGGLFGYRRNYYYQDVVTKAKVSSDFILRFSDKEQDYKELENRFMVQMMKNKEEVPIIFFEGDGPDSVFQATCRIKKYANITEVYEVRHFLWWSYTVRTSVKYDWVKYISVDLKNASMFRDGLQEQYHTNRHMTGHNIPIHLQGFQNKMSKYLTTPLMKFSENFNDVIVGYKNKEETTVGWVRNWWNWGWYGFASWWNTGWGRNYPISTSTQSSSVSWMSIGKMGIKGQGLLANLQGLEPDCSNMTVTYNGVETSFNFKDQMSLPDNSKDIGISSLAYKTNQGTLPPRIKNALTAMYTRCLFYPEQSDTEKQGGVFISLDVPFRNLLSVLVTQAASFKFAQSIFESVDFEILHQALLTCVDKCVIKANGLDSEGNKIEIDRAHVLYDYWMEMAIILFADKSKHIEYQDKLKTEFLRKISKFDSCIETLERICSKDVKEWSFNNFLTCFNIANTLKEECEVGPIEKFMFSYLHILYNYRFYFIAKRFNKENGTMWIMRALESVLDFVVPFEDETPPPPLHKLNKNKSGQYKIAFYEIQNTTSMKRAALVSEEVLDDDRVKTVYVKIEWATEKAFNKWKEYEADQNTKSEAPEVVEVFKDVKDKSGKIIERVKKYAFKPVDGLYQFISDEFLENNKNKAWNALHIQEVQRREEDIDEAIWQINWGDAPDLTPIRWNVFGTINVDNLLEYSKASVSAEELICLIEDGSDFWTVHIPDNLWPRKTGYITGLKLHTWQEPVLNSNVKNDAYITMLGPMANTIYPITLEQERPVPGVSAEVPDLYKALNKYTGGYK